MLKVDPPSRRAYLVLMWWFIIAQLFRVVRPYAQYLYRLGLSDLGLWAIIPYASGKSTMLGNSVKYMQETVRKGQKLFFEENYKILI